MGYLFKKFFGTFLCALLVPVLGFAQTRTVKGTVIDENNEPLVGVYVLEQGTQNGTITELDGSYSINVQPGATLVFQCVGFETLTQVLGSRETVDVKLFTQSETLEGSVVIGYGTIDRSNVTGSVASVGGETLRAIPATDASRALDGRVAGVQMVQTSSRPGASMEIRIRGQRSLSASNDPLIVLDGVPFMGSITDISPSDIKSMDILKDASSTAIYGSRGGNGVILITTYKGVQDQKPRVSFNAYAGAKTAVKYPMMGGQKYIDMRKMAGIYTNSLDESDDVNTDWQDLFYRTGLTQNYDVSVTGGSKGGSYRFGLAYYEDQAVIPTQEYNRISINGSVDQQLGKYFKFSFSTLSNYNTNDGNQVDVYAVLSKSPLVNPYNEDGTMKTRINMPSDSDQYLMTREVVERLHDEGTYVSEQRVFASYNTASLEVKAPWIEGLSYKISGSFNYRGAKSGSFTGTGVNGSATNPNSASWSQNDNINWTVENLLTYDRTFGKHHINVVGLYSAEQTTYTGQYISGKNIPNELFQYYNIGSCVASDITVSPGSYSQYGLVSWMGRAMYTYDNKYMLSVAVRSDASSRLAPSNRWHTYPAVSAGWNVHREPFMEGTRGWLDELKLRVGYGETSNQAISPYATLGSLNTLVYNFGDERYATGYYVSTLPNDQLGWEYSQTWNFGLDFAFFGGRLTGSAEYYSVKTNDILLSLGLPSTAGVGSYTANIGKTSNKGFELTLNGTIIDRGDWTWTAGVNFYVNRNKLVELADGSTEDTANCWFVGYPINCLYDYEYDGLWQEGDPYMDILEPSEYSDVTGYKGAVGAIKVKYHGEYNENGEPVRAINSEDRVPISAEANFAGGFNTNLRWRNLDLSVIGAFQSGGILLSSLHTANSYLNMLTGRRGQIDVDYWTPTNTSARYPRPGSLNSSDNPKYASTLGYFDGSFLKIRTITLGYSFHRLPALRRAGISNLRVYVTLQNPGLVLFSDFFRETGLDPEANANANVGATATGYPGPTRMAYVGFNTPNTRNYLFGINLTF